MRSGSSDPRETGRFRPMLAHKKQPLGFRRAQGGEPGR